MRSGRSRSVRFAAASAAATERSVANLVAGPRVLICDACVDLCAAIVAKEREKASGD